jgi:hypothetical protein
MIRPFTMTATLSAALFITYCSFGDILNVPGDFATIQGAITAASDGDEVVVAPGTYPETINLSGRAIIVRSTDPNDAGVVMTTIIDGGGSGSVVTCDSGEGSDTVLSGFVITNGLAPNNTSGGGMTNIDASPTVTNCSFIENRTFAGFGGGMYNDGGDLTIFNCSFIGNTAEFGGNGFGGGMYNVDANPTVANCSFIHNTVGFDVGGGSGFGGGMYNDGSSPTLTNSPFSQNATLGASGEGGGMYNANNSNPTLTGCSFIANTSGGNAGTSGAGMYNDASSPTMANCMFNANSGPINGGGMYNTNNSNPSLTFCSFIGNAASVGAGMANDGGSPMLNQCSFVANAGGVGGGMASAPADNPTLLNTGFCGNTPDAVEGPFIDLGGNSLEYCWVPQFTDPCPADLNGDGTVNVFDLLDLLAAWGGCP